MISFVPGVPSAVGQGVETLNKEPVDSWTIVHVLSGIAAGAVGLSPLTFAALSVGYEVLEYAHEWPKGSKLFGSKRPESGANIVVDLAANTLGFVVGAYLARRR